MPRKRSWNPIAFVPIQVTLISSVVYLALFALLIWVHESVPSAPSTPTPAKGVNLTDAWLDLSFITDGYRPLNSRRNGEVKEYLLKRIDEILSRNGVDFKTVDTRADASGEVDADKKKGKDKKDSDTQPRAVTVFVDGVSNATMLDDFHGKPWSLYSESENIMVYIRGTEDANGDWWDNSTPYEGSSGVLVSAHYDSVCTGFGATDDGVGVVSILQLISHFTIDGNQPRRGIVALLNNGEEVGLLGAYDYLRHPLSQFTHTFLNLEGAGAGGRTLMFRATDAQVASLYGHSPRPFGSIVSADGFKRGFIRSGTDYSVLSNYSGMRGVDVAFFRPRARYHTDQDDARNTNAASVWNMLSTSLATVKAMTAYKGNEFDGGYYDSGKLDIGTGAEGVWFDVFGRVFAVIDLSTVFALTVALAAAGPIIFIVLEAALRKSDKWYPLAKRQYLHSADDDEAVHFSGLRGLFRFPIAFTAATAAVFALAYLLTKINPFIVYSSDYAVWAMMLCAWISVAWFFLAGADRVRPTALQRMYVLIWLYALSWVLLVGAAIGENHLHVGSGYFLVIYNASVFVALLISYLELFALPKKTSYVEHVANAEDEMERHSIRPGSQSSRQVLRGRESRGHDDDEATERTSLLRGGDRRSGNTFKRRQAENESALSESDDPLLTKAYEGEQAWSSSLPQWTWIVQFLVLAPINIIILGQIALLITAATGQTGADGNPSLPIYLLIATFTVLLLLPLTPFMHRFPFQVPALLFLVLAGCLVYNLLAFPFSRDSRLKFFFGQTIDLNTGVNQVTLTGADGYLQTIIGELPSAIGQPVHCKTTQDASRADCSWHGLAPNVLDADINTDSTALLKTPYASWLDYNVSHSGNSAQFTVRGRNTKSCLLEFDRLISSVHVEDAASDQRWPSVGPDGSSRIRLVSREWDKTFRVNVTWAGDDTTAKNQTGRVWCSWSDANRLGTIPAFDEVLRFQPVWSTPAKILVSDALVEGWKDFKI